MTLADRLTFFRLALAPVFFAVYLLPSLVPAWFRGGAGWTVPVLWVVFVGSEITDMLDGIAARRQKTVSDFGKLFDPFADTLMQLTCFLCFVLDGIFPAALFLVVVYREFGILFLRNLMLKKGVAMGARRGGKIKTVAYITAGALALLTASFQRLELPDVWYTGAKTAALAVFCLSVVLSVVSFCDYLVVYRKEK
jgi:CDP-diacylglycerol--glycerol-3-phosphate 3-phosphatidyltransferase